jgi:hypothetical protein
VLFFYGFSQGDAMTDFARREFLAGAAAFAAATTAALVSTRDAEAGDPSFMNNVVDGNISVTMFGSHGWYRAEEMEQGDVGYIPQGYGHSIENVGSKPCRVLIGFNTGVYETIDLSQWIAGNPPDVLATHFNKPAALFEKFPHKDIFIADKEGR